MKDQETQTGPRCPECGQGQLIALTQTEEFDYDLGGKRILKKVRAENVPVKKCNCCDLVTSGPAAARVRLEAICRAAGFPTLENN